MNDLPGEERLSSRQQLSAEGVEQNGEGAFRLVGALLKQAVTEHRDREHPGAAVLSRNYYITYEEVVRP